MVFKEKYYDFAVTDFDGTIYNSKKEISPKTVEVIKKFIEKGGTFCVCTGRMTAGIIPFLHKYGLNTGYVISYNGAEIANVATGEKVYKNHVSTDNAVKVLQYAEKNGFDILVYPNDKVTVEESNSEKEHYLFMSATKGQVLHSKVSEYMLNNSLTTGKMLFLTGGKEAVTKQIMSDLPDVIGKELDFVNSNKYHIDLMNSNVNKGSAIQAFAKMMGLDMDKLICFGDAMNDESMLKVAGLSVVVADGDERLKATCDVVTDACDNDGVAKAMQKYCI